MARHNDLSFNDIMPSGGMKPVKWSDGSVRDWKGNLMVARTVVVEVKTLGKLRRFLRFLWPEAA